MGAVYNVLEGALCKRYEVLSPEFGYLCSR